MVEVTYRTVQGRYLLRPSRQLNRIVVGIFARAQKLHPVKLIGLSCLSNHLHLLLRVEDQEQLSGFMNRFGGDVVREINRLHGWEDSIWRCRYRAIVVTDEESAQLERVAYLLAQGVKEGLVAKVAQWPGLHFGQQLQQGRCYLVGEEVDRTALYRARQRGQDPDRQEFVVEHLVELHPPPCMEDRPWREYCQWVERTIRDIERRAAAEREREGRAVLGVRAILEQHPHARPTEGLEAMPAPRVHAASKKAREEFREAFGWFLAAFREASARLRAGERGVVFPQGCFPPGLPYVRAGEGLEPGARAGPGYLGAV